ncbi:MAG: hypothetical protein AAF802_10070 [Planctomycetota bacterium]
MQVVVFLLLVAVLLAKVIVVALSGLTDVPGETVPGESAQWWELGTRVAQGDWGLRPNGDETWEPLYPWLIGLLQRTTPRPMLVLMCLQTFLWTATMVIVSSLCGQLARRPAAPFLAIGVAIVSLTSLLWATSVSPVSLFAFLLVVHAWQLVMLVHRPSVGRSILAAISLGLLALTNQNACWLGLIDFVFIVASLVWPMPGDRVRRLWVTTCVGGLLLFLPIAGVLYLSPSTNPDRTWPMRLYEEVTTKPSLFGKQWALQAAEYWQAESKWIPQQFESEKEEAENPSDWSINIPYLEEVIRFRLSQFRVANACFALVAAASLVWMMCSRATRPAGIWLTGVLAFFQTLTGYLGEPVFVDRVGVEPLVLTVILVAVSMLAFETKKKQAGQPGNPS